MRIVFASTVPVTLDAFMRGQLAWISGQGHEVHVVSSPGVELQRIASRENVIVHALPMQREVSLLADARALWLWMRLLRSVRPDVVVVGTPKAGLVGGVAAAILGVPRRVYFMRGARFEGSSGLKRRALKAVEWASCRVAHAVVAVSPSLAALAIREHVVDPERIVTVGAGSSNGVDLTRFRPPNERERAGARRQLGVPHGRVTIAYLGRLHPDKGLDVLAEGLRVLADLAPGRALLLVGGVEEGANISTLSSAGVAVRILGQVQDVPTFLHACDLVVLPTQREGFPNVVLEAAATGLPVVTTDATGAVDSVLDGSTGIIVPRRDGSALGRALAALVQDPSLRARMGAAARERAERDFANTVVWKGLLDAFLGPRSGSRRRRAGAGVVGSG